MKNLLLALACALTLCACSDDLSMQVSLPGQQGTQGVPGLSAYEVWIEMVENGTVEWREGTEPDDFFRFLKGKDGKDGISGVDGIDGEAGEDGTDGIAGIDGRSAYDLWVEAVGGGIGDPHNPGKEWSKSKTSMSDFYYFMTGNDGAAGISAYGLWVTDVRAGIIENPHQLGTLWPADQTTMMDFWHYLRGEDGEDGEDGISPPQTNPGQAGQDGTPVSGKPNVLVRFQNAAYSEYVNPEDGTVKFQVFNDAGAPAPLAEVQGMPGVSDQTHVFKADDQGYFTVSRAYLPSSGSIEERFGSCLVSYTNSQNQWVSEESVANTYVPQRVDVRLRVSGNVSSTTANTNAVGGAAYVTVPILVERRLTDDGEWDIIPAYLEDDKYYFAYELSDPTDPTSFTYGGKRWNSLDIAPYSITTTTTYGKRVERPSLRWDAMALGTQSNSYHLWDNRPHYVNIVLESYYGMVAHANAVIQVPPVQFMPLPTELTMSDYNGATRSFGKVSGTFDMNGVSTAHYYEANLRVEDRGGYTFYSPTQRAGSTPSFTLLFKSSGNETKNDPVLSNLSPAFSFNGYIEVDCDVYLMASGRFFVSPGNTVPVGTLKETSTGVYHIVPKDDKFVFANIPVTVE